MQNPISRLSFILAAAGLALTPIAAQANTRAGDSNAVYATSSAQPGLAREAEGEGVKGGGWLAAFLAALVAAGVIIIVDDEDDQSPGT